MYPVSGNNNFENDLYSNIPNASLMFTMYTTTFGNMNFMVQPATKGEVQGGFPSVPYLSLEALLYQGQSSNPNTSPTNVITGNSAGVTNLAGATTQADATGSTRVLTGQQQGNILI